MPSLTLYSTSVPITLKLKKDIARIKRILDAKMIEYEEVDLAVDVDRRQQMLERSNGIKKLPQLHVDDKCFEADAVQELEDCGELEQVLKGESVPVQA